MHSQLNASDELDGISFSPVLDRNGRQTTFKDRRRSFLRFYERRATRHGAATVNLGRSGAKARVRAVNDLRNYSRDADHAGREHSR